MKKSFLIVIIIMIISSSCSYGDKPEISAQSAVLMDAQSNRILLEYNPHLKLPMASTTKIMTALVALENEDIKKNIKIKENCIGIEGSSIYLQEGEIISLEDLLYGLMLRSGNDAAIAIANHIGKGVDNFVRLMNQRAKGIGANSTNFMNPHGLHDDNHYTTAYDLALITSEAMKIDKFKEIVSTKVWKANRDKNNIFYNKNKTLWEYDGGDGVKTGYTIRSGRCLVTSATRDDTQLIAVVLNDSNWFEDCYKLMNYGFENYANYVIFDKGQYIKNIPVLNGDKETVAAVTENYFKYPLSEEELKKIKVNIDLDESVEAPIRKGDILGNITVYLDGKLICKEEIISREDVNEKGLFKKIIDRFKNR